MVQQRSGIVTFQGRPVTLLGPELKAGDSAPDFECLSVDMKSMSLASTAGKVRVFSAVGSLDSSLCDQQTRRFDQLAAELPSDVAVITVSSDLPFTQARWSVVADASAIVTYSDYRGASFGLAYGVLIKEWRLLARSVFVVDGSDVIRHVQIVPDMSSLPNFDAVLRAVSEAI